MEGQETSAWGAACAAHRHNTHAVQRSANIGGGPAITLACEGGEFPGNLCARRGRARVIPVQRCGGVSPQAPPCQPLSTAGGRDPGGGGAQHSGTHRTEEPSHVAREVL